MKKSVIRIDSLKPDSPKYKAAVLTAQCNICMRDTKSTLLKMTKYIKLHKDCEKFDDYIHILDTKLTKPTYLLQTSSPIHMVL